MIATSVCSTEQLVVNKNSPTIATTLSIGSMAPRSPRPRSALSFTVAITWSWVNPSDRIFLSAW